MARLDGPPDGGAEVAGMRRCTLCALAALLSNAILCAAFAEHADTFITTTAMLSAVAILTIREDHHG